MSCRTITVFSSKGGVGKTFVSVNLATELAIQKKRVLLIDFDFQNAQDVARMLHISPRGSIHDVLMQTDEEESLFQKGASVHNSGLQFIPAVKASAQIGEFTAANIKRFFERARKLYDFIIIDAGKTMSDVLIHLMDQSNLIFLVTTPDVLSVYQVRWCQEFLQKLKFPLKMMKLILNRSESRGSVAWQDVQSALTNDIFSHIPSDGKAVGLSINRGIPVVIDSPKVKVTEAFQKMSQQLMSEDIFFSTMDSTNVDREKSSDVVGANEFWKQFGISEASLVSHTIESAEEDELMILKKEIHEKLVDRMNLEGLTSETLSDPKAMLALKKKAERVVADLIVEETGGKISSHQDRAILIQDIVNEALGLGPIEAYLADPDVTDILVNNKNFIYVERHGRLERTPKKFISDAKVRSTIDRIIAPLGRRIDESTPMVNARLPDGSRINAVIPPLSLDGPMISIRKFARERIGVEELINKYNSLPAHIADFLESCVKARKNVIVSGGTGSGKTTLLNIVSQFIPDEERIITIEDAAELQLRKQHWARLESRPKNVEGKGEVTIRDLFINSLRMRPDRVIIGECRGSEVLDMLQAMNTGHDGSMTTIHANSARDVITRMHSMILLSGAELPVRAIHEMIGSAIDIIVQVNRFFDGTRKVVSVSELVGLDEDFHIDIREIFEYEQHGLDEEAKVIGQHRATGYVPQCYEHFKKMGLEVQRDIFDPNFLG